MAFSKIDHTSVVPVTPKQAELVRLSGMLNDKGLADLIHHAEILCYIPKYTEKGHLHIVQEEG